MERETESEMPPGQHWGQKWIIYAALDIPKIDIDKWRLKVTGLVEKPLEYGYEALLALPMKKYVKSFHCLLPDSIIYSNPEPIEMRNVRSGTMIIGGDGRRHKVRNIITKSHSGKVIGVKATYLPSARMTPDHPVLAVKGHPGVGKSKSKRRLRTFSNGYATAWIRADELKLGDYVFFPKYKETSTRKFAKYGKFKFAVDGALATILGWYVAGGSPASSEDIAVAFSLNSSENEQASRLRGLLWDVFAAKTHVYSNERKTLLRVVTTSNKVGKLTYLFKEWCGNDALTKKIPDFILNAKPEILKSFLASYLEGNGYTPKASPGSRNKEFIDFTTSSKTLAYQLLLALSKLGMPGDMASHPGSVRDGYSIRVRGENVKKLLPDFPTLKRVDRFHYKSTEEGFYFPIRKIWTEEYSGRVYDFQAPGYTMLSPFVTQDCVTAWSIKDPEWEGVPIRYLADAAGVKKEATWVMFHCADGYTAPVPLEDALNEDSIVALKLNGKPLVAAQGFPARPFFPQLYGWKSAKWVTEIEFIPAYKDGYWEAYGYHERADVWDEERFKGGSGKHQKRRAFGTVG